MRRVSGARNFEALRAIWVNREDRRRFLGELQRASVYVDVLADVLEQSDVDQFDLLAHLTFSTPVYTRSERATAFLNREGRFIEQHTSPAQEVILGLLEKYRAAGIEEMTDPRVFRLPPFREMGQAPGVVRRFGSASNLNTSLDEIQRRLYA